MATDADRTRNWYGSGGEISRARGVAFEVGCLLATLLALGLMVVFIAYVFNDAVRPFSADPGWLVTMVGTVVGPMIALSAYFYLRDTRAAEVASVSLGLPIVASLLAAGIWIVFEHVVSPAGWFAVVVSTIVAVAAIRLHGDRRSEKPLERFGISVLVPVLALVGIPAISVDYPLRTPFFGRDLFRVTVSLPELLPSLREVVLSLPVLPTPAIAMMLSFTLPVGLLTGQYVRRVRESDRDATIAAGATILAATAGIVLAPVVDVTATTWIVFVTVVGVPVGLYVDHVLRRGDGVAGLAFPIVVGIGAIVGTVLVRSAGFAGPDLWLDWSFLTSPHSTTPRDAGIYPPLVGTVMMVIVVAVSAFPVGIGAAIYLEEYAPNGGPVGSVVDLIEINIANLAGVPSVVYGVLGLALFVRGIGLQSGIVVVGGLTIALLILPIVIVASQEAIRSVPDSQRQASYGMGATKWQTVRNVVLPRALPGIMTGTILALGRAIGETAPLLMIGAAAVVRIPPRGFFDLFGAMPRQIFAWSREIDHEFRHGVLAAGALTLLVVLLMMNGAAILIRNKYQREHS